jgi:hypothetical protein
VAGFLSLHSVQAGSGARPASWPSDTGGAIRGGKAAGPWSWLFTAI